MREQDARSDLPEPRRARIESEIEREARLKQAKGERARAQHEQDAEREVYGAARREQEIDDREDDVELLFNRQRPGMGERIELGDGKK